MSKKRCCGSIGCRKLSNNTHIQRAVHKNEAIPEQSPAGARGGCLRNRCNDKINISCGILFLQNGGCIFRQFLNNCLG